jgi:hypothetical protein
MVFHLTNCLLSTCSLLTRIFAFFGHTGFGDWAVIISQAFILKAFRVGISNKSICALTHWSMQFGLALSMCSTGVKGNQARVLAKVIYAGLSVCTF